MNKETLFIAFSTQRGGMGKTTFTVFLFFWFHLLLIAFFIVLLPDF
jgi:hypothetical protein